MSPERLETEIDGRHLALSNLDKVLYPKTGFTKGELLDYYVRIAPFMLPHIEDRVLTQRRYPNGVEATSFFEKHIPSHAPPWVRTAQVPSSQHRSSRKTDGKDETIEYVVVCDRATLVWAANLATIEFHVPLWRVADNNPLPGPPDHLVFDLDPGPGTSIVECCRVATWISKRLSVEGMGPVFPKTSGSKGLQLYVGLSPDTDWEIARNQALEIAESVEQEHGDLVVTNMRKELRKGRVLIDWSQNHPAKTTVAAYSLRAMPEPRASTPVSWDEVATCERKGDPEVLRFLATDVLARVEHLGDLMAPLVTYPD